jgi:hypothetical protein
VQQKKMSTSSDLRREYGSLYVKKNSSIDSLSVKQLDIISITDAGYYSDQDASIFTNGGIAVGKSVHIGTMLTVASPMSSVSPDIGAVQIKGGVSIGCAIDASSATNGGSLTLGGGFACAKSGFFGSDLTIGGQLSCNQFEVNGILGCDNFISRYDLAVQGTSTFTGTGTFLGDLVVKGAFKPSGLNLSVPTQPSPAISIKNTSKNSTTFAVSSFGDVTSTGSLACRSSFVLSDPTSSSAANLAVEGNITTVRCEAGMLNITGTGISSSEIPLHIIDPRIASFPAAGCLVAEGGVLIKKNMIIGQSLNVQGATNISGNVNIGSSVANQTSIVGSLNVSKTMGVAGPLTCDTLRSENGYFHKRYVYNISNIPNFNITPQVVFNGIVKRKGDGGGTCTDKFPDYSTLAPLIVNAAIGLSFSSVYINTSTTDVVQFVPGVGATIYGKSVLNPGSFVSILVVITSLSEGTYDVYIGI